MLHAKNFSRWAIGRLTICALVVCAAIAFPVAASASDASVTTDPGTITETDSGAVGFAILGSGLIPRVHFQIHAGALLNACQTVTVSPAGGDVTTDYDGRFNAGVAATGCVAGEFPIAVVETNPPNRAFLTNVTIKPPRSGDSRFSAQPAREVETGEADGTAGTGAVAFTLVAAGFTPGEQVALDLGVLRTACRGGVVTTGVTRDDFASSFVVGVVASGCDPGTYSLIANQGGDVRESLATSFEVKPPTP
jgi:hypothetical protein